MIILSKKFTPRWVVLIMDLVLSIVSLTVAYYVKFNFEFDASIAHELSINILIFTALNLIFFLLLRSYTGVVRHSNSDDLIRLVASLFLSHFILLIFNMVHLSLYNALYMSNIVLAVSFLSSVFFLTSLRLFVRYFYEIIRDFFVEEKKVILVGSIENCLSVKHLLLGDRQKNYKITALINKYLKNKRTKIENINILSPDNLFDILKEKQIKELYFCDSTFDKNDRMSIVEACLDKNVRVFDFPVSDFLNNDLISLSERVKKIEIEDLLGRDSIRLNNTKVSAVIQSKRVMVTGAAGSIGSELVTQLAGYKAKEILALDTAETPLYELKNRIEESGFINHFNAEIVDVRDKATLGYFFKKFKPEIVFHTAAYKHVPLMEANPVEAINTNVKGTMNVADCCNQYGVEKMVFVSSDKAVNPTNIMGASKRLSEIYVQSLNNYIVQKNKSGTKYITTRFGNVLGSNGSVIPRFKQQIEKGGPVTITHPEINRYFMTIPEACHLVFEAGIMGNGGEVFIFDMGKSVKIKDLAYKMIKLYGLAPEKDINIIYTGLRPGEKLYEELINNKENTIPTHHHKIMIALVQEYAFEEVQKTYKQLFELADKRELFELVKTMKQIVPEFKSNNSVYEKLDKRH